MFNYVLNFHLGFCYMYSEFYLFSFFCRTSKNRFCLGFVYILYQEDRLLYSAFTKSHEDRFIGV